MSRTNRLLVAVLLLCVVCSLSLYATLSFPSLTTLSQYVFMHDTLNALTPAVNDNDNYAVNDLWERVSDLDESAALHESGEWMESLCRMWSERPSPPSSSSSPSPIVRFDAFMETHFGLDVKKMFSSPESHFPFSPSPWPVWRGVAVSPWNRFRPRINQHMPRDQQWIIQRIERFVPHLDPAACHLMDLSFNTHRQVHYNTCRVYEHGTYHPVLLPINSSLHSHFPLGPGPDRFAAFRSMPEQSWIALACTGDNSTAPVSVVGSTLPPHERRMGVWRPRPSVQAGVCNDIAIDGDVDEYLVWTPHWNSRSSHVTRPTPLPSNISNPLFSDPLEWTWSHQTDSKYSAEMDTSKRVVSSSAPWNCRYQWWTRRTALDYCLSDQIIVIAGDSMSRQYFLRWISFFRQESPVFDYYARHTGNRNHVVYWMNETHDGMNFIPLDCAGPRSRCSARGLLNEIRSVKQQLGGVSALLVHLWAPMFDDYTREWFGQLALINPTFLTISVNMWESEWHAYDKSERLRGYITEYVLGGFHAQHNLSDNALTRFIWRGGHKVRLPAVERDRIYYHWITYVLNRLPHAHWSRAHSGSHPTPAELVGRPDLVDRLGPVNADFRAYFMNTHEMTGRRVWPRSVEDPHLTCDGALFRPDYGFAARAESDCSDQGNGNMVLVALNALCTRD